MQKQHKDILRTLVTALRHRLAGTFAASGAPIRGDLDRELERLGFDPDGHITPLDALVQPTDLERRAYQAADARIAPFAPGEPRRQARAEFVERAAYTWINRLLALRTMEARELIDETLRPNPAYDGVSEALFLLRHSQPARTQGPDGGWQAVIDDACARFAATLPGLFDPADPNASLRPTPTALRDCIRCLGGQLPGATYPVEVVDAVFRDPDVLGWAYQFYQQEAKDRVYAKLNAGGKIETRREIAAATQLFTEPYMVKWMLQNSLGRTYHESHPESKLPAGWEYYIREDREIGDQRLEIGVHQSPISNLQSLSSLTLLDPSMGSGHILREGFDMLFAMYREQHPEMAPQAIAQRILAGHLYGIDIDPRAAQLAALTLLLRAWETINVVTTSVVGMRTTEVVTTTQFPLNLATTPVLAPGALDRHLQHHPEDEPFRPILAGVFAALEQAHLLGSLLRPEEHLDAAIAAYRRQERPGGQLGLLGESTAANRLLEELGKHDPGELKRLLLERVARSFAREAAAGDVGGQLLGREAGAGVHLLQLLGRRYAVVCTNPPYMGSKNMDAALKRYVEQHYKPGKRDLYAAFILRCLELCQPRGRVAMITQQSWMFLKSFADLRALPEEALATAQQKGEFTGLLRETSIEGLAHLGPNAFEEISGEVVQNAMFTLGKRAPGAEHRLVASRLVGLRYPLDKSDSLRQKTNLHTALQQVFVAMIESPLLYWLPEPIQSAIVTMPTVSDVAYLPQGLTTADNLRFLRNFWEIMMLSINEDGWCQLQKGGGYKAWTGLQQHTVDWRSQGARIKEHIVRSYPYLNGNFEWVAKNIEFYFAHGLTYTSISGGSLGARWMEKSIFSSASNGIFVKPTGNMSVYVLAAYLNSPIATYMLRAISQKFGFETGHLARLPIPELRGVAPLLECVAHLCFKLSLVADSAKMMEYGFDGACENQKEILGGEEPSIVWSLLATAFTNDIVSARLGLSDQDVNSVFAEIGTPAGLYPIIIGYHRLPDLTSNLQTPQIPQELIDFVGNLRRVSPSEAELARIKANLQALYEAGPGAKADDLDLEELDHHDDEEAGAAGAYIPIPTETFLEELSVKLQIHPISVYWLLEELRGEGVRCKPEEQRLLEDRLSVLVLRLLGHRWPKQIEAGEPLPAWADGDGVIPLTPHTGEATLADRVRARLRAEEGDLAAQRTEALLQELTGRTLAEWLRRDFFKRHVSQFKKRPIAWHLTSGARGGGRGARKSEPRTSVRGSEPAFECMVYYHRTDTDILARIRTQYVERLLERERGAVVHARRGETPDATAIAAATERIRELEAFAARLRQVEEQGFACPALDELLAAEALDRWSGDGVFPPANHAALLAQEQAWQVDINDGVRVNVAPLQGAGLLASDVLAAKELPKAIADRARWRSDERRWVRAGKLPRCGWMREDVPESPAWTELAPERERERLRLEEKRKKVMGSWGRNVL